MHEKIQLDVVCSVASRIIVCHSLHSPAASVV